MSRSGRFRRGYAAGVVALAVAASACDITVGAMEYKVREEKRFAVSGPATINLSTFDGSIEVRGWDRQEVLIEVEKQAADQAGADAIRIDATHAGNVVTVTIPEPASHRHGDWRRAPSARIVASVPLRCELTLRSGDGSVSVRRVNGALDVRTEDGSIRIDEVKGRLLARTGDGSITIEDLAGSVDAETGDGSIALDGTVTGVRLETNDGSVRFRVRTGSAVESDWSISTGDGSVRGELPKGINATIDAESGGGRVSVEGLSREAGRNADRESRDDHEERRSARGALGAGGKNLTIRTGDGSITVQVW